MKQLGRQGIRISDCGLVSSCETSRDAVGRISNLSGMDFFGGMADLELELHFADPGNQSNQVNRDGNHENPGRESCILSGLQFEHDDPRTKKHTPRTLNTELELHF